jgi:hypothetical protein
VCTGGHQALRGRCEDDACAGFLKPCDFWTPNLGGFWLQRSAHVFGFRCNRSALPVSEDPKSDRREAAQRPTEPQRRYLERGLSQPGGKLPLFDADGREVAPRTVQACVANGWAEPWLNNPIKPDWLVCRLTAKGYAVLGRPLPDTGEGE